MGGLAFAQLGPNGEPPLLTPRMSPKVYQSLSITCLNVIKEHYKIAEQLADAPQKQDFGDIDFLVQEPLTPNADGHIARSLKAERTLTNSLDLTLAIPRDNDESSIGAVSPPIESPSRDHPAPEDNTPLFMQNNTAGEPEHDITLVSARPQIYAQVDIRRYPTNISLHWVKFCHSYGDLGQILGYLSYELGITSNDKGFHVRIAEQETWDWKASMIFLSNDPAIVTQFLGLDWKAYCTGFKTEEALLDWVSKSKTAKRHPPRQVQSDDIGRNDGTEKSDGVEEVDVETPKENADHRRRMQTRSLFARFITETLPTLPLLDVGTTTARQNMLRESLVFFDKQEEYNRRILQVHARNEEEVTRLLIMKELTDVLELKKDKAREIVRAIKRWASFVDKELSIRDLAALDPSDELKLSVLLDSNKDALSTEAVIWIRENMSVVKDLERARAKEAKAERAKKAVLAGVTPDQTSEMLKTMSVV